MSGICFTDAQYITSDLYCYGIAQGCDMVDTYFLTLYESHFHQLDGKAFIVDGNNSGFLPFRQLR